MFLQVDSGLVADSLALTNDLVAASDTKTLSILELITSGGLGSIIIIGVLFILFLVALYIFFERIFTIKKIANLDPNFMYRIKDFMSEGKIESALEFCRSRETPEARMIERGLTRIGQPTEDINSAIENIGKLEVFKLDKNISILATISGAAPMIGFLGTVIGMIMSFFDMANSTAGGVDISVLSEGLYTAMTTTAAGLIVGIFAYVGYNHLVSKVDKVVNKLEILVEEFMEALNKPVI